MTPAEWSLVAENLGLIGWASWRLRLDGQETADSYDSALDALICAARHWRADRGSRFGGYAGRLILRRVVMYRERREQGRASFRRAVHEWAMRRYGNRVDEVLTTEG